MVFQIYKNELIQDTKINMVVKYLINVQKVVEKVIKLFRNVNSNFLRVNPNNIRLLQLIG